MALSGTAHDEQPGGGARFPILVYCYLVSALANCVGGAFLSRTIGHDRFIFLIAATLQFFLLYFTWRLFSLKSPLTSWPLFDSMVESSVLQLLDQVFSVALVVVLALMGTVGTSLASKHGPVPGIAAGFGFLSLLLLSGYPLQLAFRSSEWWSCVLERFPMQRAGLVLYTYIPATLTFAVIVFGATLLIRKVISPTFFGAAFLGLVLSILLSTVLSMEVHLPFRSTQKLIISCPSPDVDWLESISDALDFSAHARRV
eukprot:CAMPEP_0170640364 /NCGR_PEP_ID=MMETSP0224-20130122/40184_1 /TAXON_ID=285029 /ORGANISM="Togula jolla, Strain CCCM 725" /LENGTH=256 /DNA_ID=CAMNT_0010970863 /DNA_START=33 /DNA_END=799 /DNA_ORIENTATION=-